MSESVAGGRRDYDADLPYKLNKLFDVVHKRFEPPMTNQQAAQGITEKTGVSVTATDLIELRNGSSSSTVAQLQATAEFFGIAPAYLTEPGLHPELGARLDFLATLRDAGINKESPVLCSRLAPLLSRRQHRTPP